MPTLELQVLCKILHQNPNINVPCIIWRICTEAGHSSSVLMEVTYNGKTNFIFSTIQQLRLTVLLLLLLYIIIINYCNYELLLL